MLALFARWIARPLGLLALVAVVAAAPAAEISDPWSSDANVGVTTCITDEAPVEIAPAAEDSEMGECVAGNASCCTCPSRWWVRAEYLLWWTQGNRLPPLLTTSPDGTLRGAAGVLPAANIVFGGQPVDDNARPAGRLRVGYDFDPCGRCSLEAHVTAVGDGANTNFATPPSTGSPILARPLINTGTGLEDAQLVAYRTPTLVDVVHGQWGVSTSSEMYSAAVLLRQNWRTGPWARWDLLGGYRFFRFREGVSIRENLISREVGVVVLPGTLIDVYDDFQTENDFHGGELGLNVAVERGFITVDMLGKVALGNIRQRIEIDGTTLVTPPAGAPANLAGGLLALPSNMGLRRHDEFAVSPELGINVACQLAPCLSLTCGYTWWLLTGVVRSGDQIDRAVDPAQLSPLNRGGGGAAALRPVVPFHTTAFWTQGINAGVQLRY
jgi:hypothetical protein